MGLYIVAQLVQKYGGKISLERKDGVLEFIVTLPKSKLGREIDALSGSKVSPKTYGEFKTSS
jgi:nitrogen-specific signal transduction histidine kinase